MISFEFLHVHIVQEAPIRKSHVFGKIKISQTDFEEGHPRNIHVKLFQNRTSSSEKIFIELLKKFHFVAMGTRGFDGIKFCSQFFKRTSQGTFLSNLVQIGPSVWKENMFKEIVDDTQRTMDTGPP